MIDETRENIVEPKRNIIRKKKKRRERQKERLGRKGIEIEIETEVRGGIAVWKIEDRLCVLGVTR